MSKWALKLGEYLALVATIVFFVELTTTDRTFPSIDATSLDDDIDANSAAERRSVFVEFLRNHRNSLIYLELSIGEDIDYEGYTGRICGPQPDVGECIYNPYIGILPDEDPWISVNWNDLSDNRLVFGIEQSEELFGIYFWGTVFIKWFEAEGDEYIQIEAPPYTDEVARPSNCASELFGKKGLDYAWTYVGYCMFG